MGRRSQFENSLDCLIEVFLSRRIGYILHRLNDTLSSSFSRFSQGPAFVPSGIFKPAYLVTLSPSANGTSETGTPTISPLDANNTSIDSPIFIEESSIDIYKAGQSFSVPPNQTADWIVNVSLALRSAAAFNSPSVTLSFPELNLTSASLPLTPLLAAPNETTWSSVNWSIPEGIPERWFPHNLGTPKLYNLTVVISLSSTDTSQSGSSNVSFTTRTGFRTIQLVQSPYTKEDIEERGIIPGDNWHFEINGKAFYSLGTNIIPFDPFYSRTTTDQVRWVLESAVMSGQNMVRDSSSLRGNFLIPRTT